MKVLLLLLSVVLALGNQVPLLRGLAMKNTLGSFESMEGGLMFSMDYKADYRLDEFVAGEFTSSEELKDGVGSILFGMPSDAHMSEAMAACSAFQVVNGKGEVLYCRNFDYDFEDGASIMIRTRPRRGYRSLGMVSMNHVGVKGRQLRERGGDDPLLLCAPYATMDGMNEKGFAVSVLAIVWDDCARQYVKGRQNIVTTVLMRLLLDRAASVSEALDIIGHFNFFADGEQKHVRKGNKVNYHFLLSDASGRSVVVEFVKEDGPGGHGRWVMNVIEEKFATNFFQSDGWRSAVKPDRRYDAISQALSDCGGVMEEDEAMALLGKVAQKYVKKGDSHTQWSVVYNLTRRTATVCPARDYSRPVTFSLRRTSRWR